VTARTFPLRSAAAGHLRPFNPYRDLSSLASLIETAFGPELASTGSHIVQDLRQLALLGPLLRGGASALAPFAGFVWYEGERLVGNVSLSPEREDRSVWTVSNVAVLPEHRGQGIAGLLMDEAIRYAHSRGVRQLILQVRPDNIGAVALYRHRGFHRLDTVHELLLHHCRWPLTGGPAPAGLRSPRPADHGAIRELLAALGTVGGQPPAGRRTAHADWRWRVRLAARYALTTERTIEVVAGNGPLVAGYAFAQTNFARGAHEAAMFVAPQFRGRYEGALWEWLLRRLHAGAPRDVRSLVSISHPEALEAAWNLGFHTQRILDQMALDLKPGPAPEQQAA